LAELSILVGLAAVGWFWFDGLHAREQAHRHARSSCESAGLQFLDDTVVLRKIRLARDSRGRMVFARLYRFEFSDTGDNRRQGFVAMLGSRLDFVNLGSVWQA
jgi:Protein of unknown function (DUF3301)